MLQGQHPSRERSPAAEQGVGCTACHAPTFYAPDGYFVVDHHFVAASTYVARVAAGPEGEAAVVSMLQGRDPAPAFASEREAPPPARPLLTLEARVVPGEPGPGDGGPGAGSRGPVLELRTRNAGGIGHSFPNAPTDLVQVWLALRVRAPDGRVLVDVGGDGPEGARRLGHALLDAAGRPVERHRLWAVDEVIELGHVPPGSEHVTRVPLGAPGPPLTGRLEVEATWNYRRLDPQLVDALVGAPAQGLPVVPVAHLSATVETATADGLPGATREASGDGIEDATGDDGSGA